MALTWPQSRSTTARIHVCRLLATVEPSARLVILTPYDDAENLRQQRRAELELTINAVRSYVQALMEKLGAHTRVQAIVLAQKRQLI